MAASLGFHRNQALEVGGFDTTMKRGSDGRLAYQLAKKGLLKVISDDGARVWTDPRRLYLHGSLGTAFMYNALKEIKRIPEYLH